MLAGSLYFSTWLRHLTLPDQHACCCSDKVQHLHPRCGSKAPGMTQHAATATDERASLHSVTRMDKWQHELGNVSPIGT